MKLIRPRVSSGPWTSHSSPEEGNHILSGAAKENACSIVCEWVDNPHDRKAISQVPESMDTLESLYDDIDFALNNDEDDGYKLLELLNVVLEEMRRKVKVQMLAMGYTPEESLPEPEINPSES